MITTRQNNYSAWSIGDTSRLERTITSGDVETFVKVTGDENPLHKSDPVKKYDQSLVPGVMLGGLATGIVGSHLPGPGCILMSQEFTYVLPVYIGEEVSLTLEIIAKDDQRRAITLGITCESEQREVVMTGKIIVKLRN